MSMVNSVRCFSRCLCCLKWRTWQWPLQLQCLGVEWSTMIILISDGSLLFSPGWTSDTKYTAIFINPHKPFSPFQKNALIFSRDVFYHHHLSFSPLPRFSTGREGPSEGFVWEIHRKHSEPEEEPLQGADPHHWTQRCHVSLPPLRLTGYIC